MKPAGRKKQRFRQMGRQPSKIVAAQLVAHGEKNFSDVARLQKMDFQRFRAEPGGEAVYKGAFFIEDFVEERNSCFHLQVVGSGAVGGQIVVIRNGLFAGERAQVESFGRAPCHQFEPGAVHAVRAPWGGGQGRPVFPVQPPGRRDPRRWRGLFLFRHRLPAF